MPRVNVKQEHPTSSPYDRSTNSPPSDYIETDFKPQLQIKYKSKSRAESNPRPWTGAERQLLIDFVVKNGAPGGINAWNDVVPGRTGNQSRSAWRALLPKLKQAAL